MKFIPLTAAEMKADPMREYNASTWEQTVDRFSKYEGCQFYKLPKGDGYEYDRFYAVYWVPEGLRFLNSVSYSSRLTSNGFKKVHIDSETGEVTITKFKFIKEGVESEGSAENTPKNRSLLAELCKKTSIILTNNF